MPPGSRPPGPAEPRETIGGTSTVQRAPEGHALKRLLPALARDPAMQARIAAEAAALAALDHPAIPRVLAYGPDWLALTWAPGEPLGAAIGRAHDQRAPALRRLVAAVATAADALAHAHARGIVHGDVKPQNLLLAADGSATLVDFGLARGVGADALPALSWAGRVTQGPPGTPAWTAPEVIAGAPPGPPADVWALGAVLWMVLAGRRPYTGSAEAVLAAIAAGPPGAPPRRGLPVHPALAALAARAMAADPAARPTAAELHAELVAWRARGVAVAR